jgi:hypothetical protein
MKIWGLALAAAVAFLMSPVARAGVDPLVERGKYLVGFGSLAAGRWCGTICAC